MANTNPPKKNQAFHTTVALQDMNTSGRFKSSPTIAAGDFKIDKDGAGFANLATLPTVTPSGTKSVLLDLSATEMNADRVTLIWSDLTDPPEWADGHLCLLTTA